MILKGDSTQFKEGLDELVKNGQLRFITEETEINAVKIENGLKILGENGTYNISYGEAADFFRAVALLNGKLSLGEKTVNINEERYFSSNGVMIDCSRNAVITVETAKDILRKLACMGHNMAMLYTEDTYEVENYPYFGYMRGVYTKAELKELDRYALMLGIELIPCIQTLGHLSTVLKWHFASEIRENTSTLLIDEEKTYDFIRAELETCRECFTTKQVHIGMDEAAGIGVGRYLDKHGYHNRAELLIRHLKKVCSITDEMGLKPMMWADMFFRMQSKTRAYLDENVVIPSDMHKDIPENVSMVYWEYCNEDVETCKLFIDKHKDLKREVILCGGIRTWVGLGVNNETTYKTTCAALTACHNEGIKNVFATSWGNDGNEVNVYATLASLSLYAEFTYHKEVSKELWAEYFYLTTLNNLSDFLALDIDVYPKEWCHFPCVWGGGATTSKNVLYQDVLLGLYDKNFEGIDLPGFYRERLEILEKASVPEGMEKLYDYQKLLLKVLSEKAHIGINIYNAYQKGDMGELSNQEKLLKALNDDIKLLHKKLRALWLSTNKPFGLERLDIRYGGIIARIDVARERIADYINGRISVIEELEAERLMFGGDDVKAGSSLFEEQTYTKFAVPASEEPAY